MHVYMSTEVSLKLWYFVDENKTEIGGMGYAYFDSQGDLTWKDIFLLPQVVSGSEVDFESTGGDAFAVERAIEDGVLSEPNFVWVSWHSHNTMGPFWSGTDDQRIAALRTAGIKHVISFVGNHKHEYKCRYDAFDIEHGSARIPHVKMDGLRCTIDPMEQIFIDCDAEVERHVEVKKYQQGVVITKTGGGTTGGKPWKIDDAQPNRLLTEGEQADSAFEITPTGPDSQGVVQVGDDVDSGDLGDLLSMYGFHVEEVFSDKA